MYVLSLLVIFCLSICSYSQDTAGATPLPEDDPKNFPYQDARKLAELGGTHWVKRRTYEVTTLQGKPTCEYAKILDKVKEDVYNLELGAKLGSKWTSKQQTLSLETTDSHPAPNVLKFTRLRADGRLGHPLLYSDYKNCHIVRIKKKDSEEYRCDLLLTNGAAKQNPPPECETKFQEYCSGIPVEVYSDDCDKKSPEAA
uniref:Putative secreted protein n=1 Tax=Ixodes scapularis TaxID=6945 RepID=Q4PMK8_IXOSC|nr:putative secreted protein [Ixodes scapularis]